MTDVRSAMVEYPSKEQKTPAYLARPADDKKLPGVIAIQEWWSLIPHIKDVADRLARAGFVALAPDLSHGKTTSEPDEARKLALDLDRSRAVNEILDGMRYLQSLDYVAPKKVGIVGWCLGGTLAIATAARAGEMKNAPSLGATVSFYGIPRDLNLIRRIQSPVLGLYGEKDQVITIGLVRAYEQELEQHGIIHEIYTYPEAGHAFFNETRPQAYHPEAAHDSWEHMLNWFNKWLSQNSGNSPRFFG